MNIIIIHLLVLLSAMFSFNAVYAASNIARAILHNSLDEVVGIATLVETSQGVSINVQINNLPAGLHGIHIHEKGDCVKPDFKSAGGHFNPFTKLHGLKNPDGYHVGDLGNILINDDGTGRFSTISYLSTLLKGNNSLFKEGGTSIVIHSGPDDLVSDPSGNAGSRIACGLIKRLD